MAGTKSFRAKRGQFDRFLGLLPETKAKIWPELSDMCHIRSTTEHQTLEFGPMERAREREREREREKERERKRERDIECERETFVVNFIR